MATTWKEYLKNESDQEKLNTFIETKFPGWLVYSSDEYSSDYPHLTKNWKKVCAQVNVTPKKIVLVDGIPFENKDDPKVEACELLSRKGYCIRRSIEFIACKVCERLLPCEEVYNVMKNNGVPVPSEWNECCSGCRQ